MEWYVKHFRHRILVNKMHPICGIYFASVVNNNIHFCLYSIKVRFAIKNASCHIFFCCFIFVYFFISFNIAWNNCSVWKTFYQPLPCNNWSWNCVHSVQLYGTYIRASKLVSCHRLQVPTRYELWIYSQSGSQ